MEQKVTKGPWRQRLDLLEVGGHLAVGEEELPHRPQFDQQVLREREHSQGPWGKTGVHAEMLGTFRLRG